MSLLVRTSTDAGALLVRDTDDPLALAVTESTSALALRVRESTSPLAMRVRGLIDPDAAAFIAASGATDTANINAFVKGIKALGLWNSMVCWPLRSSQNAGSGTTVFSLGGLGTFNGTLVNGPTWGADGLVFDADNKHLSTPIGWSMAAVKSAIFEASISNTSGSFLRIIGGTTTPLQVNGFISPNWGLFGFDFTTGIQRGPYGTVLPINTNSLWTLRQVSNVRSEVSRNQATYTGATSVAWTGSLSATDFMTNVSGRASFFLVTADGISLSQTESNDVQNLYKSTLGQGLGLP
jgi:hypothetical protein